MDKEGVYEIFNAACGWAGDYGVHDAVRSFPWRARCEDSQFVGVHLPLTRRLPKRLDVTLQQSPGLHRYDAVVLADVDPVILDADDLWNLLAYVECGGGLLLMAGPHSFGKAQRNWGPLREALPAAILMERRVKPRLTDPEENDDVEAVPVALWRPHAVTRGLSGTLGVVPRVAPIHPRKEGTVLAAAGGYPLIVAGTYGVGRVMMLNAFPVDCPDSMFKTQCWADLLRQAMMWLIRGARDLVIESCDLDPAPIPAGDARTFSVELADEAQAPLTARATLRRADPGWLSTGREPQWGPPREVELPVNDRRVRLDFTPPQPGLWRVRLDVGGAAWANARVVDVEAASPRGLRVRPATGRYVTAPGRDLALALSTDAPGLYANLRVFDRDGELVREMDAIPLGRVDLRLPDLAVGHYELVAETAGDEARMRFYVTNPLAHIGFDMVTTGVAGLTEEQVQSTYDYFRERGFNAAAMALAPVPGERAAGGDSLRALAHKDYLVQRDGLDLWGEYQGATLLRTHGVVGDEGTKVTVPCLFDPEHDVQLYALLAAKFAAASIMPRMTSLEIIDEPHLYRANVCHCERCAAAFRARFGHDLPTWDEALAARDRRTRNYFEWIVDYATEAFRRGHNIWDSFGPGPKLHHVFCGIGSGCYTARNCIAEDLPWAPTAHFFEFDCYNFMYAHWRPKGQLLFNEFHYRFGHFRFLAHRTGRRFGFFIQVTDRDVPVAPWDPIRSSSEILYTAVGGGAKFFHLMAKGPFTNTQNCREEKFDVFAEDVRKVQRAAPLLDRAETPRSRIAMIFPFHDRLYRQPEPRLPEGFIGLGFYGRDQRPFDTIWPNHAASWNVSELLFRGFGETDVIDQRALHDGALDDYRGFVLTGTDYIADEDAEAIVRFVERGGSLVCDHVPTRNTDGAPSDVLRPLFSGEPQPFYRNVTVTAATRGQGRTLLFSHDLNELYTSSVEAPEPALRYALKDTLRAFFLEAGIAPHAFSADYDVEADVLLTPDTLVLVCVNHAESRRQSRITLDAPPVLAVCAFDLATMLPHPLVRTEQGLELEVDLDEREGLILGLYPDVPTESAIRLDRDVLNRGDSLGFEVVLTNQAGQPARGDQLADVTVIDPRGDTRREFGGRLCARNGRLRIDAPLGINARRGPWLIRAFDPLTTRQVSASFTVT